MIVYVFTHEIPYETGLDLQIFSTLENAKEYGEQYAEWLPDVWSPFPAWIIGDQTLYVKSVYRPDEELVIRLYELDEALRRLDDNDE